jgi:YVTN family beta-propeller protein
VFGALAIGTFVVAHTWLPAHIESVTGRDDAPTVSCNYCHKTPALPLQRHPATSTAYVSPQGMAVSADGRLLYVAASGSHRLLEVDLKAGEVVRDVPVPGRPHGVALSPDGSTLAISCRDADEVVLLDTRTLSVQRVLEARSEPLELVFAAAGDRLFVAAARTDDILILSLDGAHQPSRVLAGNEPYALAVSGDRSLLAVSNRLARPGVPGRVPASEITLVELETGRVARRWDLPSAHLSEGVAVAPDGSFVLASAVQTRNLLPLTQVARGAVMNSALAFVELSPGSRPQLFPLAEANNYYADPSGVALTPDANRAFVAHGGARTVTAVDVAAMRRMARQDPSALEGLSHDLEASSRYVLARIPTRDNPRTLALSPDGKRLFVAEHLADSIAVIDTEHLQVVDRIELGGPRKPTQARRGEILFHDASGTFQRQFSCRSCHPDGHTDGLIWDFEIDGIGKNLLETRSLRGIRDTAPFKWNGKNKSLTVQCGPRFARVLTRSEPFSRDQLESLVAHIESIPLPPRRINEAAQAAVLRGEEIFYRTREASGEELPMAQRCSTCHRPPLFTDRLLTDVGTGGKFDTPHLFDVGSSAPYLHDGRAPSLEEIWTVHSPDDTHGITNDLSKVELNDLVLFLRSL